MAIFDFLKKGPEYVVEDVDFHGGASSSDRGKKQYGDRIDRGSMYVFPRLHMQVDRTGDFHWYVRIVSPKAKWVQGKDMPEGYAAEYSGTIPRDGKIFLECPGIVCDDRYLTYGSWHFFLMDEQDNILVSKSFYIDDPEQLARLGGYIRISSLLFSDSDAGPWLQADQTRFNSEMAYLYCRAEYARYGQWDGERDITLDVEVVKHGRQVTGFSKDVTVKSGGGTIEFGGWGTESADWYSPGEYEYRILFEGSLLRSSKLNVLRSLKDDRYLLVEKYGFSTSEVLDAATWLESLSDGDQVKFPRIRSRDINGHLWFAARFMNCSYNPIEVYYKVTTPDGDVIRPKEGDCPEGFSGSIHLAGRNLMHMSFSFQSLRGGKFIDGQYLLSIWAGSYVEDAVCVKVVTLEVL